MKKVYSALRSIRPIARSWSWLKGPHRPAQKLSYYPQIVISYANYFLTRRGRIKYMGRDFRYDSRVTPLGLMLYPEEVGLVLKHTPKDIKYVLDVGANIGQFAITLSRLLSSAKIDSFEPHPITFDLLNYNTQQYKNIRTYNYGIGSPGKKSLYFSAKRSVNASLIVPNATYRTGDKTSRRVQVDIINDIAKTTGRKHYDLIKVDVEGYEYQTLRNIQNVSTSYLYLEITGQNRAKDYQHSQLFQEIQKKFGDFDILYTTRESTSKFETLLKFK